MSGTLVYQLQRGTGHALSDGPDGRSYPTVRHRLPDATCLLVGLGDTSPVPLAIPTVSVGRSFTLAFRSSLHRHWTHEVVRYTHIKRISLHISCDWRLDLTQE